MASSCLFPEHNGSMTWHCRMPSTPLLARLSLRSVRSFATTGTMQGGYTATQEVKTKIPLYVKCNILELAGGGSRAAGASATAASVHLQSACMEKGKNLSSLRRMTQQWSEASLIPAGHTWSHNREELQFLCHNSSSDTKLHTRQGDAGHHRQIWEVWAWCVSLLHFLTTSNIIIVTHNTREYNCCSDYLQPLH